MDGDADGGVDVEVEDPAWTTALPEALIVARGAAVAALGSVQGGVVVLLTDDDAVQDLNARFRGQDKPTNVLAFPVPAQADGHLGDIALAYGTCEGEARAQGKPFADHLRHLVVHGVLHLLGYDHHDDAQAEVMEGAERMVLAGLGTPDPYSSKFHDEAAKDTFNHGR